MMVGAFLNGIHARSEALLRTTWDFDKRKVAAAQLDEARRADVRRLVQVQEEAGLSHFTDGNLRWQDLFRPFLESSGGLDVGALTRYFETNTFYKAPVVTGTPLLDDPKAWLQRHFDTDLLPRGGAWKAILPSPYWFAKAAEVRGGDARDAAFGFARVLNDACQALMKNRYQFIQFNEPRFLYDHAEHVRKATGTAARNDDWDLLRATVQEAAKGIGITTSVHFQHGDPTPFVERFQDLPTDAVGLDFTLVHVEALPRLRYGRGLAAGVLDSANSLVESPRDVARLAHAVRTRLDPDDFWIGPLADLDFVPQSIADEKVRVLGQAAREVLSGATEVVGA